MFRQLRSGLTLYQCRHTQIHIHLYMCYKSFGYHHTFKQIYRHKISGMVLDSSVTPHKHVHTHILSDIPFLLPACQGFEHTLMHMCAHTQIYKHMWTWLQSCGWLTNGTVFIFCLRHSSGNDSIIVLSAQHSLPISSQHSFAAGYPRLWNLQRHTLTHTHTKNKKESSLATVVNKSHENQRWCKLTNLILK